MSLTPMRRLRTCGRRASSCGSSTSITSRDVNPLTARLATRWRRGSRATSWFGQRSVSSTDVPIVYESPRATKRSATGAGGLGGCRELGVAARLREALVSVDEQVLEAVAVDADPDLGVERPALALDSHRQAVA